MVTTELTPTSVAGLGGIAGGGTFEEFGEIGGDIVEEFGEIGGDVVDELVCFEIGISTFKSGFGFKCWVSSFPS